MNQAATFEVSVVVPCHNEESGVAGTLAGLRETLDASGLAYEILAVDDGSTDGTAAVLEAQASPVRKIANPANLGYGASIKRGIREARAPLIAIIDADGTYPSAALPKLIDAVRDGDCHMAVAARTGANVAIPLIRRPAKWFLRALANYVVGYGIEDINSGLRVFPRELALRMIGLLPDGFSLTTTITLAMLTNGYSVSYQSIDYYKRIGKSKIRPLHDTLGFLQLTLRMALYFAPMKVFLPVSLGLILGSIALAVFTLVVFGKIADVSTLVLAMTGIQVGAIGLVAELIRWSATNRLKDD